LQGKFKISEDYDMEKSIFAQMDSTYHTQGDYFLPDLTAPEENNSPSAYGGQQHLRYIREHHRGLYVGLQLSGKLNSYLVSIDQQTEDMFFWLVNQIARQEDITEELKAADQMAWVGHINNIRKRAEEIINANSLREI